MRRPRTILVVGLIVALVGAALVLATTVSAEGRRSKHADSQAKTSLVQKDSEQQVKRSGGDDERSGNAQSGDERSGDERDSGERDDDHGTPVSTPGTDPTSTPIPPTATSTSVVPPDPTQVPPTGTQVPPTATSVPPTATTVPPTATTVPPTATKVPPTATKVPPTATKVPPTATPGGNVANGSALFSTYCNACHPQGGKASGAGPSLIGVSATTAKNALTTGSMKSYASGLTSQQINDLVAYITSLK